MEKSKPVVTAKNEVNWRDKSMLLTLYGIVGLSRF